MAKRTKRYGGFLIGDKVLIKDGSFNSLRPGEVVKLNRGYVSTKWMDPSGVEFTALFMPNQLINLTRNEEELQVGGFRVGDKVRPKNYRKDLGDAIVWQITKGEDKILVNHYWSCCADRLEVYHKDDLINLTRQLEDIRDVPKGIFLF